MSSGICLDKVFWSSVQLQKLEAATAVARKDIQAKPKDAMQYVQLATLLHKADYMAPDGGSRIAEAEDAYRYCDKVRLSAQLVASKVPSFLPAAAIPLAAFPRVCRSAIRHAPNSAMEAGVLGNMGALLLGVAGRVEDGLDAINRCIARFSEARIGAKPLYAGQSWSRAIQPVSTTGNKRYCTCVTEQQSLAANQMLGWDKSLGPGIQPDTKHVQN